MHRSQSGDAGYLKSGISDSKFHTLTLNWLMIFPLRKTGKKITSGEEGEGCEGAGESEEERSTGVREGVG